MLDRGESYDEAFKREVYEELNIDVDMIEWRNIGYVTPNDIEVSAFMKVYELRLDHVPEYNTDDFIEYFWFYPEEFLGIAKKGEGVKSDLPPLIRKFYMDS